MLQALVDCCSLDISINLMYCLIYNIGLVSIEYSYSIWPN